MESSENLGLKSLTVWRWQDGRARFQSWNGNDPAAGWSYISGWFFFFSAKMCGFLYTPPCRDVSLRWRKLWWFVFLGVLPMHLLLLCFFMCVLSATLLRMHLVTSRLQGELHWSITSQSPHPPWSEACVCVCLRHKLCRRVCMLQLCAGDGPVIRVLRASSRRTHQNANGRGSNFRLKTQCSDVSWPIVTAREALFRGSGDPAAMKFKQAGFWSYFLFCWTVFFC